MFLLALIAVAFLPLLVTGLQAATANTTVTTATQVVNEQLSPISAHEFTCTEVKQWLQETPSTLEDSRGVTIYVHRAMGSASTNPDGSLLCATGGTVTLQVTATSASAPAAVGASTYTSAGAIVRIKGP